MYALKVNDIEFGYDRELVLKGISFNIEKGKFISIIGPNGSGKSTLLKTLNNLYKPTKGNIFIEGNEISSLKGKDLAKRIALVPQNTNIDYDFTVEDIVLMGRHPYKGRFQKENQNDYSIIDESLKMTNTLHLKDRPITEISGGERQRVIIAKALAQRPTIILLDEPTSHLDINHQIDILNLLKNLNKEKGTTIILVIHDINLAARYSDEIILLNDGVVLGIGKPEEVITTTNVETAYNLNVVIDRNKYTNSLYLTPVEIKKRIPKKQTETVHIICGGGTGAEVINRLYDEGFNLTLGVLNVGDSDWQHGKSLMIPMVEEAPFTGISEKTYNKNSEKVKAADIIVISSIPFSRGNLKNLISGYEGLKSGKKVFFIWDYPDENFDYTDGKATKLINEMKQTGMKVVKSVEDLVRSIKECT
ncbi:ABC transporter ATP-binding protein [Tissierella sp. MSJ-40]|uniref:ABC transporter ATP-binding protein n=1 Tax=Tissierella simiarum TaxID=2841534 RepID=A0ABS6E4L8_9FIRM|nr:ABC transporter ATP-binding protein [Tissierella simiarum]MBU5437857.1 ABC transporter ATP-binding protein [Tissierella simiarum]